jgi:putative phosphoesterase
MQIISVIFRFLIYFMMKIGLLSDTHGFFDPRLKTFFADCNEIWHAGDIGNLETADEIANFKPLKAVHGNIDGHEIRIIYPENLRFNCEGMDVWITHIGGYPGNYDSKVRHLIRLNPPELFITGHSHILKVIPDKKSGLLHINPGAAGKSGFHHIRTAVRFIIEEGHIKDLEVIELGPR